VIETIEVLENLTELSSLKDEELDIIGELLSNMYGALEVQKLIKAGTPQKEALNTFMQRVLGASEPPSRARGPGPRAPPPIFISLSSKK